MAASLAALAMAPFAAAQVSPATSATVYIGDILSQPADGTTTSLDYGHTLVLIGEQLLVASPAGVDVWQCHPLLGYHRRQRLPNTASALVPWAMAAKDGWFALGRPIATAGEPNGHVMLFSRGADGTWSAAGTLLPTGSGAPLTSGFGKSVAFDGETLVVGHPGRQNGRGLPPGGIEVFERSPSGGFAPLAVVPATATPALGGLGTAVSVSGATILATHAQIGLPSEVAWFERTPRGIELRGVLSHPEAPTALTGFGTSIALEGTWCAISAPSTVVNGMAGAGAVYVYEREGDAWVLRATIAGAKAGEGIGRIAMDDGMLAVGEQNHQEPGMFKGRVRLFRLDTAIEWIGLLDFDASELAASELGRAVSLSDGRLAAGFRHLSWSANQSGGAVVRRVSGAGNDSDGDGDVDGIAVTVHGEPDCDGDLVPDSFVAAAEDCDGDGTPDRCQLEPLFVPSLSPEPEWGTLYGACSAPNTISMFLARIDQPSDVAGPLVGVSAMIGCSDVAMPPPSFIAIYTDPNQDGDPGDAMLVGLFGAEWPGPWGTVQRAIFPPIDIGGPGASFFVGFGELGAGASTGMGPHRDPGPLVADRTWLMAGPTASFNVESPFANAYVAELGTPPLTSFKNIYAGGLYAKDLDPNLDGVMDACACTGDLLRDGVVDERDLALLLGAWVTPDADVDGSGLVGAEDIGLLLGSWGRCSSGG